MRLIDAKLLVVCAGILVLGAGAAAAAKLYAVLAPDQDVSVYCPPRDERRGGAPYLVGIVGDSWIADRRLDSGLQAALQEHGIDAAVLSRGVWGAKTKRILHELVDRNGLIQAMAATHPDRTPIVLIEGGINDSMTFRGPDYYTIHVRQMVEAAIGCGVHPIVLTIPFYDREGIQRGAPTRIRWSLYRLLTGDSDGDNAALYNAALEASLADLLAQGRVSLIDARELIPRHETRRRYYDGVHLTADQNDVFGRQLGAEVAKIIRARQL